MHQGVNSNRRPRTLKNDPLAHHESLNRKRHPDRPLEGDRELTLIQGRHPPNQGPVNDWRALSAPLRIQRSGADDPVRRNPALCSRMWR